MVANALKLRFEEIYFSPEADQQKVPLKSN